MKTLRYKNHLKSVKRAKVHVDIVVADAVVDNVWMNYEDAFSQPLRKVKYLGTYVWVPSEEMTHKLLVRTYGADYMTPVPDLKFDFDPDCM